MPLSRFLTRRARLSRRALNPRRRRRVEPGVSGRGGMSSARERGFPLCGEEEREERFTGLVVKGMFTDAGVSCPVPRMRLRERFPGRI